MAQEREEGVGLHETFDNGDTLTVNDADDPAYADTPGAYYQSQTVDGEKTTTIYSPDADIVGSNP